MDVNGAPKQPGYKLSSNIFQDVHTGKLLCIYLIHKFHILSWITEINWLFHNILIYWDAPVINYDSSAICLLYSM